MAVVLAVAATSVACVPPDTTLRSFPDAGPAPVVVAAPPDSVGPLRIVGRRLVDASGRTVLLHGVNSVAKSAPFITTPTAGGLGDLERAWLTSSGFNSVRLGVAYSALMPTPGVVDQDYLDQVLTMVDELAADGFWVLLDFHQDVFHLMPEWATPPDALALSADPPPLLAPLGWAAAYTSPRSLRQWDAFLSGEEFVQVAPGEARSVAALLGEAGAALASAVADRDRVIGIELLNEPFSGSAFLRCILEGCPDVEGLLADRYAEMTTAIRAAAPETIVWQEPFAPTGYVAPGGLPPRAVPPTSDGAAIGVAWHLYCHDTDGGRVEEAPPATAILCRWRFDNGFANGEALGAALDAPTMLNEFGASQNPLDVTLVTQAADAGMVSWMYWHQPAVLTELDAALPDAVETQIVRPAPQATAGRPLALSFDPASGVFRYSYRPDLAVTAPTSVVVPARQYPRGYDVAVTGGTVTSAPDAGRLTVVPTGAGDVSITVTRR